MTEKPLAPEEETQALAAEYALGLLRDDDLQTARQRLASDPAFAAAIRDWQERLAPLADDLTPVMPPTATLMAVHRALGLAREPLADVPPIRAGRGSARSGGAGQGGWFIWLLAAILAGAAALAAILLLSGG
ncbi:hypothetical protein FNJ84_07120 [Paracoccus sp. M683]|uniref:hypothetical protein n=1 Tax=Paracoccus sp. M683 TaxID=2594268 RepID=UPI00117E7229|nr:hypothetical protein [Paracoccus sp. M683]TRW97287.1 hypothetical protein FNJ84_07120 [Paracoccus sp. M683]